MSSKPSKRERSVSTTDAAPGENVEQEAVQTLSQLSDLVNQSQTLSQLEQLGDWRVGSQIGSQPPLFQASGDFVSLSQPEIVVPVSKPIQHYGQDNPSNAPATHLHKTARGTRRGPMDEMRQLARILVKIIPHSVGLLAVSEEGGGARARHSCRAHHQSPQVATASRRSRSSSTSTAPWATPLGPAGACQQAGAATCLVRRGGRVPNNTPATELFTWILGAPVSEEQAMRCAKREPGRSWEAIPSGLHRLGTPECFVHRDASIIVNRFATSDVAITAHQGWAFGCTGQPSDPAPGSSPRGQASGWFHRTSGTWPLLLMHNAPCRVPLVAHTVTQPPKRRPAALLPSAILAMNEVELWKRALDLLRAAGKKAGTYLAFVWLPHAQPTMDATTTLVQQARRHQKRPTKCSA